MRPDAEREGKRRRGCSVGGRMRVKGEDTMCVIVTDLGRLPNRSEAPSVRRKGF